MLHVTIFLNSVSNYDMYLYKPKINNRLRNIRGAIEQSRPIFHTAIFRIHTKMRNIQPGWGENKNRFLALNYCPKIRTDKKELYYSIKTPIAVTVSVSVNSTGRR